MPELKNEKWINYFCDQYAISNYGRVRRIAGGRGATPGRLLRASPFYYQPQYPYVTLSGFNRFGDHQILVLSIPRVVRQLFGPDAPAFRNPEIALTLSQKENKK